MDTITLRNRLRNKKIGILVLDARQKLRFTAQECADALGISINDYQKIEAGDRSVSLPELEILSYLFNLPIEHFWKQELLDGHHKDIHIQEKNRFYHIRNRMISINLRLVRSKKNLSVSELARQSGITEEKIRLYEMGDFPIPISDLETLADTLEIKVDQLIDRHSMIGQWRGTQLTLEQFLQLPQELRDFVLKPVNQPYLKLAVRLSDLSAQKLRAVAESLLEITY